MSILDRFSTRVGSPEDLVRIETARRTEVHPEQLDTLGLSRAKVVGEAAVEGNVTLSREDSQYLNAQAEIVHETGEMPAVVLPKR